MKYMIVEALSIDILEIRVSRLLKEGWKLQGGITVSEETFYQAMFKR